MNYSTSKYALTTAEIVKRQLNGTNKKRSQSKPRMRGNKSKERIVKELEIASTNNIISTLENDIDILNTKIEEKKTENLELIEYFQNEMENLNEENEKLNESQEIRVEKFQKNYYEFDKIFQYINNEIQQCELGIQMKGKEILETKEKINELKIKEREHFDNLYNMYLQKEKSLSEAKMIYQTYIDQQKETKPKKLKSKPRPKKLQEEEVVNTEECNNEVIIEDEKEHINNNENSDSNEQNEEEKEYLDINEHIEEMSEHKEEEKSEEQNEDIKEESENKESNESKQESEIVEIDENELQEQKQVLQKDMDELDNLGINKYEMTPLEMDYMTLIIKFKFIVENISPETLIYNAIENDSDINFKRMGERSLALVNNTNQQNVVIIGKYFENLADNTFDLDTIKKNLYSRIENIPVDFIDEDENVYKKKLCEITKDKKDLLIKAIKEKDYLNLGIITFSRFLSALQYCNITFDNKLLFYSIFLMKIKNCTLNKNYMNDLGIFDLIYENFINIIDNRIKYIDIRQVMKIIEEKCKKVDIDKLFAPLNSKLKIIGEQKYYLLNDLNTFLKEKNILGQYEEISMENFSEMLNAEFFINAIKIENENEEEREFEPNNVVQSLSNSIHSNNEKDNDEEIKAKANIFVNNLFTQIGNENWKEDNEEEIKAKANVFVKDLFTQIGNGNEDNDEMLEAKANIFVKDLFTQIGNGKEDNEEEMKAKANVFVKDLFTQIRKEKEDNDEMIKAKASVFVNDIFNELCYKSEKKDNDEEIKAKANIFVNDLFNQFGI